MKATTLSIFRHLFSSIPEETGITLGRTAYSPNINERLDFSCAIFLGDGLVRTIEFLAPVSVTVVSERRKRPPYTQKGGRAGACGRNSLIRGDEIGELPGKFTLDLQSGDKLRIETPGGGGWGSR